MDTITYLAKILTSKYPKAKIYLVGGSVRDRLIGRQIKDFDLVITGLHGSILEELLRKLGTVKLVGKNFAVYKWTPKNKPKHRIDIALPRREYAGGTGARRDFKVWSNPNLLIDDDLGRRDFTINAIAFDICTKRYIDPFAGRVDIKNKIIKTVGKPENRFQEDYSRMLRAIRLACHLDFKIDSKTWQSIKKNISKTRKVVKETTASEIIKALSAKPCRAMELFDQAGFWAIFVPEMVKMKNCQQPKKWHSEGDVWAHTKLTLSVLENQRLLLGADLLSAPKIAYNPNLVLALLFHDIGKPATFKIQKGRITFYGHEQVGAYLAACIIKRLKLESAGINREWIKWLIRNHMLLFNSNPARLKNITIERYFFSDRYPSPLLLSLIECDALASVPADADKINKLKPLQILQKRLKSIRQKPKPLLSGREVMKILKFVQGPMVGKILCRLREAQLSDQIKNKQDAKDFIKHDYSIISRFSRAKSEKSRNRKIKVLKGASNKRSKINKTIL